MNKTLRLIYKYDFGLYYPFYVFCKSLRILGEKIFRIILGLSSSRETRESREKGWRMATSIFNQDFDDSKTFYLIDIYLVMFWSCEAAFITGSAVVLFLVVAIVYATIFFLFYYKDKRKKQFSILRHESKLKKVLWTVVSYTFFVVMWYIFLKIEPIIHPMVEFLREWNSIIF